MKVPVSLEKILKIIRRAYIGTRAKRGVRMLNLKARIINSIQRKKLRKYSPFDYEELSQNIQYYSNDYFYENEYYGNNVAIRNALGYDADTPIDALIEHGLHFGRFFDTRILEYYRPKKFVTFSNYRKEVLIENGILEKNIMVVGPYIKYIASAKWTPKNELNFGRTLVVFYAHSIEGVNSIFDANILINEIKRIRDEMDFRNIIICMYWRDLQEKRHLLFEKEEMKIVTAGHRNDISFLSRLKSIIELADMTMSNKIGTHVGYCISLGKPHFLFQQKVEYKGENVRKQHVFSNENENSFALEEQEVLQAFGKYSEKITSEQLEIIHKYWGPF